jgi:hypothetical protein
MLSGIKGLIKLVGKLIVWAGFEFGRSGRPNWQFKLIAGVTRGQDQSKQGRPKKHKNQ